ncbi:hypothetical protein [Rhodoplanes sp. Z2-YC6860]|uniref:hypothetical protein n=1 Tax=Rhodoplanes sp. Z2-YC6860 TaxID=674703 RepID=UPI0012EEC1CC|nr:hypothetical protein [Rhodoplanes sp. Z2-YC6860]
MTTKDDRGVALGVLGIALSIVVLFAVMAMTAARRCGIDITLFQSSASGPTTKPRPSHSTVTADLR